MFNGIIKIICGAITLGIVLIVLIFILGTVSEQVSETIPEDSKWAETQKNLVNTSQSAIDILSMDPTNILMILVIFGLVCAGGYAIYLCKK